MIRYPLHRYWILAMCLVLVLLISGCSSPGTKEQAKETPAQETPAATPGEPPATAAPEKQPELKDRTATAPPATQPPAAEPAAPAKDANVYRVKFETTQGDFVVEVHRDWAPIGADHFRQLVESGFYDEARFFRVLPNFVAQFGIPRDPALHRKWSRQVLKDDPVKRTNAMGTLVYATAGPNTRTTQLFINLRDNARLDGDGFAPFGQIVQGMGVVTRLYGGYGERPDQKAAEQRGNAYFNSEFPQLDYIKKATIL
jgi:peptidyl-prolyl cis-trans isomerase A (cyclophilin A)